MVNLNEAQLIDKIIKIENPPPFEKLNTYDEFNELRFPDLRNMAKSIEGIGEYGYLNKDQLINKLMKMKKQTPPKVPAPRTKKSKIIQRTVPQHQEQKNQRSLQRPTKNKEAMRRKRNYYI